MSRGTPPPTEVSALHRVLLSDMAERATRYPDLRWAERIVLRAARGARVSMAPLRLAREALGPRRLHDLLEERQKQAVDAIERVRSSSGVTS